MNNEIPELPKENNIDNNQIVDIPNEVHEEVKPVIEEVKEVTTKEIHSTKTFLKDIREYITTKNSSELFALLWRLIIVVGFIIILYFPFQLLMDLGMNFFLLFGVEYTTKIATIWSSVWNISYGILALVLFFVLIKDRYYKFVKNKSEKKEIIVEENK